VRATLSDPDSHVFFSGKRNAEFSPKGSRFFDSHFPGINHLDFILIDIIKMIIPERRPLIKDKLVESIRKTGQVLTVEQHSTHGGCGSLVAELIAEKGLNARLSRLGVPEGSYTKNATSAFNKIFFGLDVSGIIRAIEALVSLK
jgi:deoxyxylulose-5-phosphate synthase